VRALGVGSAIALAAGVACLNSAEPRGFIYQYQVGVHACDSLTCDAPDSTATLATAAPGDTVWLRHDILLLQAAESTTNATIRPDCAENARVAFGGATVQSLPEPVTCEDSVALQEFALGGVLTRFTQWVLDSTLVPGNTYSVMGRVLVQPRIEPTFGFIIQ
jgi:hypothetical protein